MFTGIIQAVGRIRDNEEIGDGLRIHVEAPELGLDTVKIGDSIAINGACMTVVEVDEKRFKVEVSAESLSKTAGLDGWGYVNLEKAMRLADRLDGHIVSGHVDGVGEVDGRRAGGEVRHVAAWGEDEHLVGEHIHLQVVEKVLRVRLLLRLEQAADPGELLLVAGLRALAAAGLVFPVCRNAVLRRHVLSLIHI